MRFYDFKKTPLTSMKQCKFLLISIRYVPRFNSLEPQVDILTGDITSEVQLRPKSTPGLGRKFLKIVETAIPNVFR